jgi:hypothetical protein
VLWADRRWSCGHHRHRNFDPRLKGHFLGKMDDLIWYDRALSVVKVNRLVLERLIDCP